MLKINNKTAFVSDTHFFHKNILKYENSRKQNMFKDGYVNHDKWIINNWNTSISNSQDIIHLGDLYLGKVIDKTVLRTLSGNKFFLKGNHDKRKNDFYIEEGFKIIDNLILVDSLKNDNFLLELIASYKELRYFNFIIFEFNNIRFLASHFPIINEISYDNKYKDVIDALYNIFTYTNCDFNIHGHSHSYNINDKRCINICLEQTNFKPILLEEICKKI